MSNMLTNVLKIKKKKIMCHMYMFLPCFSYVLMDRD